MISRWTVVSVDSFSLFLTAVQLAVMNSLDDALEYAAFVNHYDEEEFSNWFTYVVEGNFLCS